MTRVYLDWNATAPLRTEARNAMGAAMDVCGNPSSIHLEGRAARKIVEHARLQVAQALGAGSADIVFTSGATEAAALALAERGLHCAPVEHPCVTSWCKTTLPCDHKGKVTISDPPRSALQAANSETGVVQDLPGDLGLCDFVQAVGKIPVTFERSRAAAGLLSAHKFGGPKGVGALLLQPGLQIEARQKGGGQELGRRSGTQNVIGIAGMGAAAEAALRDLEDGRMREVGELRDFLESRLADEAPKAVFIARDAKRLPNTSFFAVPGWLGETQVMQMDLAGFAVSAGSACSSGKVRSSGVLGAMGYDDVTARSTIRVSIGADTTRADLERFADVWLDHYKRFLAKAA